MRVPKFITAALIALTATGCATSATTLVRPDSGGAQLFRALKYLKRPTAMILFPRETHELSRSGQPWHRIERLQHIVGWFDKWLMGMKKPEYEVTGQ